MDRLIYISFVLCVLVIKSSSITANDNENITPESSEAITDTISTQDNDELEYETKRNHDEESAVSEQRSIAEFETHKSNVDHHEAFRKRAKPLKNIFMGIYRNYKSTYLGNKTFEEYKRKLRTHALEEENQPEAVSVEIKDKSIELGADNAANNANESTAEPLEVFENNEAHTTETELKVEAFEPKSESTKNTQKKKQRGRKRSHRRKKHKKRFTQTKKEEVEAESPIYNYDFGAVVNMSLDMNNEIVKLHLEGDNLRDIMQGRWLSNKNEARGKKYDMITKVLPLFIIPFLIQSAIVPFLVTKLKLLLMKSILVGKLAIFLLVISAIRNSSKMMQTYEVAPSYWAGEPSRRSELAAAASSAAYNGYRVEGKPTAWIN